MKNYNSKIEKLNTSVLTQLTSLSEKGVEASPKELTFRFKKKDLKIPRIGSNSYSHREYDTDGKTVKLDIDVNNQGGIYYREKIDNLFNYGEVYTNGIMRAKGISSWLGFSINKSYKYDDKGKLIETIDYDEGYEFNYKKVLDFCKKNKIDILSKKGPNNNTINNITLENGRKVWVISYHNMINNKIDTYQLDGQTGEIIQKWLNQDVYGIKHY